MSFISRPLAVLTARNNDARRLCDREHIRIEHRHHGAAPRAVSARAEPGVQIGAAAQRQHPWIKLGLVAFPLTEAGVIVVVYITVKFNIY